MSEDPQGRDARLLAAEAMSRSLASHPGATPGMRRLAEALVAAVRRATEDPTAASMKNAVAELDARASELLGVLAVLHGVVVRRDEAGAARALVEAERTLSQLQALEGGTRMLDGDRR